MSYDATVSVYRTQKNPGATTGTAQNILNGILVQIDNASLTIAQNMVGAGMAATPFDAYSIYVYYGAQNAIQRGDVLIDSSTPDPNNNNQPTRYRVIGNPEWFPDSHVELYAARVHGT